MALMGALQITEPPLLIGVINDLGERGDARAAPALAPMTESRIPAARQAAMNALAGIPDRVSLAALKRCVERKEPGAVDALLRLGENAGANGRPELAQAVLEEVSGSAELEGPQYCRAARLIVYAEPGTYTTEFLAGLVASYGEMGNRYLGCLLDVLAEMPGTEATKAIAGLLQKERRQVLMGRSAGLTEADLLARLLGVLGWRGVFMTEQAADVMVEALREPDERVRLAAVQAIEQAGVASGVDALVSLLSDGSAAVRDAAEHAICHMNGDEATRRIMAGLEGKPAELRVKLLSALGYRGSPGLVLPALEKAAGDSDERVRAAALRAIARTRTKQEPPH
jgi:HEAT repeat protein